jgi:dTDP-4-dehydrorhamnose reductase
MAVIVFGGCGLIGSQIVTELALHGEKTVVCGTRATMRSGCFSGFSNVVYEQVDVTSEVKIQQLFTSIKPKWVVNAAGLTKHHPKIETPELVFRTNSLGPHVLQRYCDNYGARFVQISTDCVFSGLKGQYTELDLADASDLYGQSKMLGEIVRDNHLTIRTSTIGPAWGITEGLLEWFLSQNGSCKGYTKAFFSGLCSNELARVIVRILFDYPDLCGLYHLGGERVSKYELLKLVASKYKKEIQIEPSEDLEIDRSLVCEKIFNAIGYRAPSWEDMIETMYNLDRNPSAKR